MRKIEMKERERDEIVIAVHITRGILGAWEMTERLHIHFDKTTSRSDGALEETEIRAREELAKEKLDAAKFKRMSTCSRIYVLMFIRVD